VRIRPLIQCSFSIAGLVAAGVAPLATAQTELREIDPASARAGGLSGSLRSVQPDFRAPSAFDRVYRLMSGGKNTSTLARSQGGLVATFPESQYTGSGAIPAGTIFHIGTPRPAFGSTPAGVMRPRAQPARPDPTAVSARAHQNTSAREQLRVPPSAPVTARVEAPAKPSVFTDEAYRARTVAALLDRALAVADQ